MAQVLDAVQLLESINENIELHDLELAGFIRGESRGKTMNVPLTDVIRSIGKQYADFTVAYIDYLKEKNSATIEHMKRTLADLRNVLGCAFLKLCEKEV